MLDDDQDQGASVSANDRQHARASSYKPVPSSHTASSSITQLQASSRTLMSRRSLDLGALAAAQAASGSGNSGAGTTNGHGNSSTSTSRFGTLAGSIFGAATISSSSGLGSNSQPGSYKRARPSNSHLFGLGLFNATNATSDGKLSSNMVARGHASSSSNNMDEREAALMGAVRAANDENAAWQITVEQVPSSEQDSLFLTGSNGGPASASRPGSATPLGRATQAAGRLFLSKSNKRSKPSPSASSTSSLEKAKKRPHTDTQSHSGPGEPLLVLYVTTGTSSLTLYRTLHQLVQLDVELRSKFPEHLPATKPSVLLEIAAIESFGGDQRLGASTPIDASPRGTQGHGRRRSVFAALGKTLKTSGKRASPPHGEQSMASPGNIDQQNEAVGNGQAQESARQAIGPNPSSSSSSAPVTLSASQLTNLADYLSGLSSFSDVRSSQEWQKFYKTRPDDHSSPHLEDRDFKKVKKLRSEADLPANHGSPTSHASDRTLLYAHVLEDSGIGGDMSSHSMMRETSAGTGSSMSIFVEAGLDGRPLTVGDPEVLAYMQSLNTPADISAVPPSSNAEVAVISGTEGLASSAKEKSADDRGEESNSHSTPLGATQAGQELEEPVVSALSQSLADEEAVAEPPVLTPELANDALASLHATSQSSTPARERDIEGVDQPLASVSNSPLRHTEALPEDDNIEAKGEDDPLSRKSSKINPRSGRKRKASTRSGTTSAIGIEDFEIVRVLGKGCAGKVLLSRSKADGSLYAVKAIHKQHVLAHRELLHTLTEQSILKKVAVESDNPFVVRMSCRFQNKDNLFLVLDFHPGGDLATQLARWGRLGKDRSRFYAAEIVEGLEGLHAAGVIHRDLKPENILLASDGHIVLTDFGLSKQFYRPYNPLSGDASRVPSPPWLKDAALNRSNRISTTSNVFPDGPETTSTFCGTAEYLAPEVLLGNPYSYPVDMWSLGTMVYEMLLGVTPFYNEDHGVMYRRVLHEPISFGSDNYLDADTRALLRGLLQKEPEFRMTTARVKKSKYFEAIDWEYVHSKRYIPPFIPALSADDPEDTQNFDEAFLKMDLGFVDPSDFEEAEVKAKRDGKEPDQPFDEEGRDVFEGYSFHGSPLYEQSDEEEDEGSILAEDTLAEEAEDGKVEQEIAGDTAVTAGTLGHEQLASTESANTSTSDPGSNSSEDDPDAYETGVTSASGTDDGLSRHTKDTSHVRAHSNALSSLEEVDSQTGSIAPPASSDPQAAPAAQPAQSLPARLHLDAPKNSVDMPRRSMEKEEPLAAPHNSEEAEDWDLLEAMEETEQAVNGQPKRKRVMAGPTLFARGFVDKYKLQIRPVTRAPTPSRSYKSSKNGISSPTAESGLSPSPSAAGMSQISLTDPPDSTKPRRLKAPKLLRTSTEWMSNSLPTSPSPRFRLNRNKRSLVPIGLGNGSTKTEPGTRAETPMSTASSSTTLPIEAAGAPLAPLTRHSTRRVDADAASGVENEDPNGDTSSSHSTASKSPNKAAARLA